MSHTFRVLKRGRAKCLHPVAWSGKACRRDDGVFAYDGLVEARALRASNVCPTSSRAVGARPNVRDAAPTSSIRKVCSWSSWPTLSMRSRVVAKISSSYWIRCGEICSLVRARLGANATLSHDITAMMACFDDAGGPLERTTTASSPRSFKSTITRRFSMTLRAQDAQPGRAA